MTPLQRVVMAAKQVKHFCTRWDYKGNYQIAFKEGGYESLRRLARAVDGLTPKARKDRVP